MKVLVVDDSRAMRTLLRTILAKAGHEVVAAENGQEALEILAEDKEVQVALVDWNMPVMDGITFVETIRRQGHHADLQIVMVTTEVEMSQVERALSVGADDYLMKPFEEAELVSRIQNLTGDVDG